eukprot:s1936_g3.t1
MSSLWHGKKLLNFNVCTVYSTCCSVNHGQKCGLHWQQEGIGQQERTPRDRPCYGAKKYWRCTSLFQRRWQRPAAELAADSDGFRNPWGKIVSETKPRAPHRAIASRGCGAMAKELVEELIYSKQLAGEDLWRLNEAIFNVPEDDVIKHQLSSRLFQLVTRIRKEYQAGHFYATDQGDYLALLGTLQNQPFSARQSATLRYWIAEALGAGKDDFGAQDRPSRANLKKLQQLEETNQVLAEELQKLKKLEKAVRIFASFQMPAGVLQEEQVQQRARDRLLATGTPPVTGGVGTLPGTPAGPERVVVKKEEADASPPSASGAPPVEPPEAETPAVKKERSRSRTKASKKEKKKDKERREAGHSRADRTEKRRSPSRKERREHQRHQEVKVEEEPSRGSREGEVDKRPVSRPAGGRAPRVGARQEPALRRPARRGEQEEGRSAEAIAEEKFVNGEEVEANLAPLKRLTLGTPVVVIGEYWQGECRLCGEVQGMQLRQVGDVELQLKSQGTDNESLLKWITGHPGEVVRAHLCGPSCPNKIDSEGLIHAKTIRMKKTSDEGGWAENLKEEADENLRLREEALELQRRQDEEKEKAEKEKQEKKGKKKKKEKKKKSSSTDGSSRKKASKSRKKVNSRKGLKEVFGTTGLDPDHKVRRKLVKALKKKMKRKKEESDSASSSSLDGSKESSGKESSGSEGIFGDSHKVRVIARRAPGVLAESTIREMQRQLLTAAGTVWDQEKGEVPAVALQYYRNHLAPLLSGGASREALTLCWGLDLALQGRIANTVDCLAQRLKSLQEAGGSASE